MPADERLVTVDAGDVGGDEGGLAAALADARERYRDVFGLGQVVHHHVEAGPGQGAGDAPADAARGAGDEGGGSGGWHGQAFSRWRAIRLRWIWLVPS